MQATALVFDVLMTPGSHAVLMRQVYNKTRTYLQWLAERVGGAVTIVDDGDHAALAAAIRPETRFVFAETFTNPLVRAQDLTALVAAGARRARATAPELRLIVDSTIATPWAFATPLLAQGVDVVLASGTKALGGTDRDLWGYVATSDTPLGQRGDGSDGDARRHPRLAPRRGDRRRARRRRGRARAALGHGQPRRRVPRRPIRGSARCSIRRCPTHPDAAVIAAHYRRHGSLLSFRVAGADEAADAPRRRRAGDDAHRPLRAVVRRPGHQGEPPPDRVGVLHAARASCAATASIA